MFVWVVLVTDRRSEALPKSSSRSGSQFALKFDGAPGELSAATFVPALLAVGVIVEELNQRLGSGERLDLRVRAPKSGSFLVQLCLGPADHAQAAALFTAQNLELIVTVIAGLGGLLSIRKLLRKERPKKVVENRGDVIVTSSQGNSIIVDKRVFNIYQTSVTINAELDRVFQTLDADPSVTGFEVRDDADSEVFSVQRSDFAELAAGTPTTEFEQLVSVDRAALSIVKVSFEPKLKWEFVYLGNRIGAYVTDSQFLKRIDAEEEAFAKGDALEVELQIERVWDAALKTFVNSSYKVVRVIEHVRSPERPRLGFGTAQTPG